MEVDQAKLEGVPLPGIFPKRSPGLAVRFPISLALDQRISCYRKNFSFESADGCESDGGEGVDEGARARCSNYCCY